MNDVSSLWLPTKQIQFVFGILARLETGAALMRQFYPYYLNKKICVLPYPKEVSKMLSDTRDSNELPGASCVTECDKATIYYDSETPLGVLVILMAHEMTHALDEELWAYFKNQNILDEVVVRSEKKALKVQRQIIQEMRCHYPAFVLGLIRDFQDSKTVFPADVA